MKKVTIFVLHMGYGGIEKCVSMLANALCDTYHIEIIATYKLYEKLPFSLNENIKIQYLIENDMAKKVEQYKLQFFHFHWVALCKNLWQDYIKKGKTISLFQDGWNGLMTYHTRKKTMIEAMKNCDSDIMITTRDIHNKWLGRYGKKESYKIGWEHNHPHGNQRYMKKVIRSVEHLDAFVLVSPEIKEIYTSQVACPCFYIPNAIDDFENEVSKQNNPNIVSVGRLSSEKGYSDLIDVFDMVHRLHPDWHLDIVGDGPERSNLEQKISRYHLQEDVTLHGFQNKDYINHLLQQSSIYAMTSFTESFGIVLLEAFSYGLPCVAFDSAEGANLLISDNWDGYLVKNRDKEQMAKRICELIQNQNRRIIMGSNGMKKAKKYQIKEVKKEWISLLEKETL